MSILLLAGAARPVFDLAAPPGSEVGAKAFSKRLLE